MRRQHGSPELLLEFRQIGDERIGLAQRIGLVRAEQSGLDRMKSQLPIGPGINGVVEVGEELIRHDFDPFPAAARRDPGLLGPGQIMGGNTLAQEAGAGQALADAGRKERLQMRDRGLQRQAAGRRRCRGSL